MPRLRKAAGEKCRAWERLVSIFFLRQVFFCAKFSPSFRIGGSGFGEVFQRIDGFRASSQLEVQHGFACVSRATDLCDVLPSLDSVASFDEVCAVVAVCGEVSVGVSHEDEVAEAFERRAAIDDDAVLCCFDDASDFSGDVDTVVALSEAFFSEATDHFPLERAEKVFAFALRGFCQFLLFGGFLGCGLLGGGACRLLLGGLALGFSCACVDDEELSDIEFVGVLDSVCLFEFLYGGGVFSSDAVERFAFFDDVSRFA